MSMAEVLPQSLSLETYLKSRSADVALKRNGVLEFPAGRDFLAPRVLAIREGMKKITDDSSSLELFPWHHMHVDAYGPRYPQEVGLKTTKPGEAERKFTFHYMPDMMSELRADGVPIHIYGDFFEALRDLERWSLKVALAVADSFDTANRRKDSGQKYAGSLVERLSSGTRVVRVLRYLSKDNTAPDATLHIDRSFFSVHPWSSHAGLKFIGPDGTTVGVQETNPNFAAIFPGEKFAAATKGIFGLGAPHGVRDERWSRGVRTEDRFAVVCFVHPKVVTEDVEWLHANWRRIEAFEKTLSF